jgi:hypothetical protein
MSKFIEVNKLEFSDNVTPYAYDFSAITLNTSTIEKVDRRYIQYKKENGEFINLYVSKIYLKNGKHVFVLETYDEVVIKLGVATTRLPNSANFKYINNSYDRSTDSE